MRSRKPYAMVGAGELVASVWKHGDDRSGWRYRFNVFKQTRHGQVGQQFCPDDLCSFVKLARVLSAELAADGCLAPALRQELAQLAAALDQIDFREE